MIRIADIETTSTGNTFDGKELEGVIKETIAELGKLTPHQAPSQPRDGTSSPSGIVEHGDILQHWGPA